MKSETFLMMTRDDLILQLKNFIPCNEQEETDRNLITGLLESCDDVFDRANLSYHMTSSAWVVNRKHTKVLMCYHKIYNSWSWLGGHADNDPDLLSVAVKEVKEESGLLTINPVSDQPLSVEILTVEGHEKKGHYVPSHLHLNVTYLLEADETETLTHREEENSAVAWFEPDMAIAASTEPWFRERIYPKLNRKTACILADFPVK